MTFTEWRGAAKAYAMQHAGITSEQNLWGPTGPWLERARQAFMAGVSPVVFVIEEFAAEIRQHELKLEEQQLFDDLRWFQDQEEIERINQKDTDYA